MLLAEMIASENPGHSPGAPDCRAPALLKVAIADGLGLGHGDAPARVTVSTIVADDGIGLLRLETAISAMRASVDDLIDRTRRRYRRRHRDVPRPE
jgi:phosphotransferase system enzyme I (PtsP)